MSNISFICATVTVGFFAAFSIILTGEHLLGSPQVKVKADLIGDEFTMTYPRTSDIVYFTRYKVVGGWLIWPVRSLSGTLTFVPDENHMWKIEK